MHQWWIECLPAPAEGSNARAPDVHWSLFHGLLYARCKGLAEQAVREQVMPHAVPPAPQDFACCTASCFLLRNGCWPLLLCCIAYVAVG